MFESFKNHDEAVYGGYLNDDDKLLASSSGGIATALAEYAIEKGWYVAGVVYSKDYYRAEYLITKKAEDIKRLRGSKYIFADLGDTYIKIKELLKKEQKVLFFGLPCTVGALNSYCRELRKNLLTCELICHGPTLNRVHKEYIENLEKKYRSKIIDFSVRYKENKWIPGYLYAKFSNGKKFKKPFYETEYGIAFSIAARDSCYKCKFKGNNRTGDIMIGDFWGATCNDSYWNDKGVSVIFAETEKGNILLHEIKSIKLFDTNFEKTISNNLMVIESRKIKPQREKFLNDLDKYGLIIAVKKMLTIKGRIKKYINRLIPNKLKPKFRKLYYFMFLKNLPSVRCFLRNNK